MRFKGFSVYRTVMHICILPKRFVSDFLCSDHFDVYLLQINCYNKEAFETQFFFLLTVSSALTLNDCTVSAHTCIFELHMGFKVNSCFPKQY